MYKDLQIHLKEITSTFAHELSIRPAYPLDTRVQPQNSQMSLRQ